MDIFAWFLHWYVQQQHKHTHTPIDLLTRIATHRIDSYERIVYELDITTTIPNQCLNNHDVTTMTFRLKTETFILNNSQNQSVRREVQDDLTYSAQKDCFLNPMCWTDLSKSIPVIWFQTEQVMCVYLVNKEEEKRTIFCWFSRLILIRFESSSPSVCPNSGERERTMEMNLNPLKYTESLKMVHKHMSNEWTSTQKNNGDSCTHLVVWKDTGPVRFARCGWTGPVQRWRASPGWRSRWTRLIRTGGTSVCGWCLGCVCVLDAVRIGTSLILHLNALLGHPSLIAPQWCPNLYFERVLCTDSVEPIRSADCDDAF